MEREEQQERRVVKPVPSGSNDARGDDGREQRESSSPWAMYQRSIKKRPLMTKAVTAAAVSALGELLGAAIRSSPPSSPKVPATGGGGGGGAIGAGSIGAGSRALSVGGGVDTGVAVGVGAGGGPGLLRRTAAFAVFGLVINGPLFHWWYGALERVAARFRKPEEAPGGARDIALKVALDRFLLTPPYLALTLLTLRLLQGLGVERSVRETKGLYRAALLTNWKVWTLAQVINFKIVPVEFRPVFGNFVACWWNVYLSLLSTK